VSNKCFSLLSTFITLQYGYGAYELTSIPGFAHKRFTLLDRGFVYVFAHIRGGGELGRLWYEEGKLLKKKNTFYDFIAAAEYLINEVSFSHSFSSYIFLFQSLI
jgi:protease II